MMLIGSRALKLRAPTLVARECVDFDFVCTKAEFDSWMTKNAIKTNPRKVYSKNNKMIVEGDCICEFEIIEQTPSATLLNELVESDDDSIETSFGWIPSLDMLFTIKSSHKYVKNSPHFWKTALDYHVMAKCGAKIRPRYKDFLALREKETYDYPSISLNKTKNEFFSDEVFDYTFEHDDIHKSVALFDLPAYTYYLKDRSEVQCDKAKFFALDKKYQLAGVIEECCVLAIERSLIPSGGKVLPANAWKFALSKVCTNITSGWFREFAYENIFEILKMYPTKYWNKFCENEKRGLIKRIIK